MMEKYANKSHVSQKQPSEWKERILQSRLLLWQKMRDVLYLIWELLSLIMLILVQTKW